MVDFQYGPFEKVAPQTDGSSHCSVQEPDRFRVFYDKLLVKEPTRVLDTHLRTPDVPLYLPPLLFTRLDQPTTYCFSSRFRMNEYVELENNSQQHPYRKHLMKPDSCFHFSSISDRKERKSYAIFVNFGDPTPSSAHPGALQAVTHLGGHTRKLAHDVEKVGSSLSKFLPSCLVVQSSTDLGQGRIGS